VPSFAEYTFPRALIRGTFLERPHRFLALVRLPGGSVVYAHVPHTGRLPDLLVPGNVCWVDFIGSSPTRRSEYTLVLLRTANGVLGCIHTGIPNRLACEAAQAAAIPTLGGWCYEAHEYTWGDSRVDLLMRSPSGRKRALVEVKSVTWTVDGWAQFPDSVTTRGVKHLRNLAAAKAAGMRAVQLYIVQRGDSLRFRPAADVDPAYAEECRIAKARGVEFLALTCEVSPAGIVMSGRIPVRLGRRG
jgi:sugar fermentation stimulation protein A